AGESPRLNAPAFSQVPAGYAGRRETGGEDADGLLGYDLSDFKPAGPVRYDWTDTVGPGERNDRLYKIVRMRLDNADGPIPRIFDEAEKWRARHDVCPEDPFTPKAARDTVQSAIDGALRDGRPGALYLAGKVTRKEYEAARGKAPERKLPSQADWLALFGGGDPEPAGIHRDLGRAALSTLARAGRGLSRFLEEHGEKLPAALNGMRECAGRGAARRLFVPPQAKAGLAALGFAAEALSAPGAIGNAAKSFAAMAEGAEAGAADPDYCSRTGARISFGMALADYAGTGITPDDYAAEGFRIPEGREDKSLVPLAGGATPIGEMLRENAAERARLLIMRARDRLSVCPQDREQARLTCSGAGKIPSRNRFWLDPPRGDEVPAEALGRALTRMLDAGATRYDLSAFAAVFAFRQGYALTPDEIRQIEDEAYGYQARAWPLPAIERGRPGIGVDGRSARSGDMERSYHHITADEADSEYTYGHDLVNPPGKTEWLFGYRDTGQMFLPRGIHAEFSGEGGVGKGHFLTQLLFSAAGGMPFLDFKAEEPMRVYYLSSEDRVSQIYERGTLHLRGWPPEARKRAAANFIRNVVPSSAVFYEVGPDSRARILSVDYHAFAEFVTREEPWLVVVDPLTKFLNVDANDNTAVAMGTGALDSLAKAAGAVIITLDHVRKTNGKLLDLPQGKGEERWATLWSRMSGQLKLDEILGAGQKADSPRFVAMMRGYAAGAIPCAFDLPEGAFPGDGSRAAVRVVKNSLGPIPDWTLFLKKGEGGNLSDASEEFWLKGLKEAAGNPDFPGWLLRRAEDEAARHGYSLVKGDGIAMITKGGKAVYQCTPAKAKPGRNGREMPLDSGRGEADREAAVQANARKIRELILRRFSPDGSPKPEWTDDDGNPKEEAYVTWALRAECDGKDLPFSLREAEKARAWGIKTKLFSAEKKPKGNGKVLLPVLAEGEEGDVPGDD
ncbi:MAG: AAA family ATPase, partial [Deltaproteobacteria bacterium]|nr:AAA family ATPase [Deltaproteobacteria bacterium]